MQQLQRLLYSLTLTLGLESSAHMNKRIRKKHKHHVNVRSLKKYFFKNYGRLKYHGHGFFINAIMTVYDTLDEHGQRKLCEYLGLNYDDCCTNDKNVL